MRSMPSLKAIWRPGLLVLLSLCAVTAAKATSTANSPRILDTEELNAFYGFATCGIVGGPNCAQNKANQCLSTGCNGTSQCGLKGSYCYQLLPNSSPTYGCNVDLSGGNCCANCSGGCYFYTSGIPNPQGGCTNQCQLQASCGAAVCNTYPCTSGSSSGSGGSP